ncbi:MAG TPA: histidinol-phosphatase HisJ family protein [Candidatus Limnocylindrales bacterium]|nr:histidinol-phosphatase HisJ family protein [Candidatus Limnocylindrales bacterium]
MKADDPTAQARDLPLDSHLHTTLSPDSTAPIDAYARQAVGRGIAEICITDHVDFEPGTPAYDFVPFDVRERTVREAAERWADDDVAIRFGVEITYDSRHEAAIREHLKTHAYDFVIGSVHVYEDSPFHAGRVGAWVAGKRLPEIVAPYFDEVLGAIRSGLFDTIGHLDFVKRYLVPHVMPQELAAAPELYERLLRALVESGTALEVNTSGLRQSPRETYPSAAVVRQFQVLGGTALSAGSDAHEEWAFTSGLDAGYRVASTAGIGNLSFRRGGERVAVALPDRFRQPTRPNEAAVPSL